MKFYYAIFLLHLTFFACSQVYNPILSEPDTIDPNQGNQILDKKNPAISLEVGTYFGTATGFGNYFGTYFAPRLRYSLSKKFAVGGGMIFSGTTGNLFRPAFDNKRQSNGFSQSLLFIEGAYRMNPKLTLTGTAFQETGITRTLFTKNPDPLIYNDNYKGLIMGVHYKLGENVYIQGQVGISNGPSYYHYSPFGGTTGGSFFNPYFY